MPTQPPVQSVVPINIDIEEPESDQIAAAAIECEVSEMMSNYYGHETPAPPSSQQRSPKSHEEYDNNYLLNDNDHIIPFDLNSKQRLRLLHHENNNDNDTTFLEEVEGEEGTEVMNGVPPVDVSRLLLDYSVLSTDNNDSIVAILHEERQQLHQPQPSAQTQMKSSGNSNSSNKDEENNTQKKVNKTNKNKDSSSWVYTKDAMIEFIAPFHEGFGCTDASDDNDDGGVQESPSRTPCKKQQSGQPSGNDKRGSGNNSATDLSPSRHRNNQAASAPCGLIDIEEAIANLIAPFYTIEDGVSQELECIISCGMD